MAQDTKEILEQVDAAISSVLRGGQSYRIGSRELTRADLGLLRTMKNDLTAQLSAGESVGLLEDTCVAFFDGR